MNINEGLIYGFLNQNKNIYMYVVIYILWNVYNTYLYVILKKFINKYIFKKYAKVTIKSDFNYTLTSLLIKYIISKTDPLLWNTYIRLGKKTLYNIDDKEKVCKKSFKYDDIIINDGLSDEIPIEVKIDDIWYTFKNKIIKYDNKDPTYDLSIESENMNSIKKLINNAVEYKIKKKRNSNKKYVYEIIQKKDEKSWNKKKIECNRNFNNIFLSESNEKILYNVLNKFKNFDGFVPNKLGLLLCGNGGTGKTATTYALANELKRNIYIVNLKLIDMKLLSEIPDRCIVLIDDIEHQMKILKDDEKMKETITNLLMTYFDGYTTSQNVINIVTSNNKDSLEPLMFRQGRIDYVLSYENCTKYQYTKIKKIMKYNGPDFDCINMSTSTVMNEMAK